MITTEYPLQAASIGQEQLKPLKEEEMYGLHYAAGYIPRSLRKELPKSKNPLKNDLQLRIFNLLNEGGDSEH